MNSSKVKNRLTELASNHPKLIDLSLGRIQRLLKTLGHPERKLPPAIHVAGTNGKGSTVAFLRAIAEAHGLRVHVFTSPHLIRFNERIRLNGKLIEDDDLLSALDDIEKINGQEQITYFELITAMAIDLFAKVPADLILLETGLGGRYDATNVIEKPVATAITRISYDHQQYLGNDLVQIAGEKAGIIKKDVPIITSAQSDPSIVSLFNDKAAHLKAPHFAEGRDWTATPNENGFIYRSAKNSWLLPHPALLGLHQFSNAGTAIACLETIPHFILTAHQAAQGLMNVNWPGRLQRLIHGHLCNLLPQESELWLDGGHNDSGGEVLARQASLWAKDGKPLDIIVGMLNTKDPKEFLAPLMHYARSISAITIPDDANSHNFTTIEDQLEKLRTAGMPLILKAPGPETALKQLTAQKLGQGRVLICGSLHLAGYCLAKNGNLLE